MELIDALAKAWTENKRAEEEAKEARLQIEKEIIALLGAKEEGTETHEVGTFKIVLTGKLDRKLDEQKFAEIAHLIPEEIQKKFQVVIFKPELVLKELRNLEKYEPDYYKILAQALTIKPAKTSVKVEEVVC